MSLVSFIFALAHPFLFEQQGTVPLAAWRQIAPHLAAWDHRPDRPDLCRCWCHWLWRLGQVRPCHPLQSPQAHWFLQPLGQVYCLQGMLLSLFSRLSINLTPDDLRADPPPIPLAWLALSFFLRASSSVLIWARYCLDFRPILLFVQYIVVWLNTTLSVPSSLFLSTLHTHV